VLCHCWYKTVQHYEGESTPADIADLAGRFPDVTLIAAHLTPAGVRGVLDLEAHANICVDTSGAQPFAGVIEYAVSRLGARRILYGSDVPGRDFSAQLGRIYGARIGEAERDLVLSGNARRVLGLAGGAREGRR
jgi:predicted TIM-barrel fold metal-dependent hydrolase